MKGCKKSMKFYKCKHCGNIIIYLEDSGVAVNCCGEKMEELVPGSVEAATEKHIPVLSLEGNTLTVSVGSVDHPMLPEHFIKWIVVETSTGFEKKTLSPGDQPKAVFNIPTGVSILGVYEYCNIHGLWKNL
jgi:superoxide reductase